ncbi:phosphoglucomutase [Clostridia bacterium]|nr:phosphoglucomutase [Clostridia bacterium]
MEYTKRLDEWRQNVKEEDLQRELEALAADGTAAADAFFKELEFGTGGLRGILGAGTNRLNIYTVGRITRGLGAYIKSMGGASACVCYDSRIKSDVFAKTAAAILAQGGIKVYLTRELAPTPFLSFITRHYGAAAGVMITASHNPARYNGYKVYGSDGCQVTDGAARIISDFIAEEGYFGAEPTTFDILLSENKIEYVPDSVESLYLDAVHGQCVTNDASGLSAVYTPLNGTGWRLVPEILKRVGVQTVFSVPEQALPDGNFLTCPSPNPEKKEALALGLRYAAERGADILLATDPDADRVGIAVRHNGGYVLLSGNETGVLLCDYILKNAGIQRPVVIKTIVTTDLGRKVAEERGAEVIDVLTGFKYIGEKIGKLERCGQADRFAFGFEESYGYLKGAYVRDKDAVVACMLICEMAAHHKKQGKTLKEEVDGLYARFGLYEHRLLGFEFGGAKGNARMRRLLSALRGDLPERFARIQIAKTVDYLTQEEFDLPKSDVLQFDLANGNKAVIRPSGTEPQLKVYLTACQTAEKNAAFFAAAERTLQRMFR